MGKNSPPAKKREWNTNWRNRMISEKRCVQCGEPAADGRVSCQRHIDINKEKSAAFAKRRKDAGLCVRCGSPATLAYCDTCRPLVNSYNVAYQRRNADAVYDHYGRVCKCCGETERMFLTIDHIDGGGSVERRSTGVRDTSVLVMRKFREQGFWPTGFQVLCYNCNSGRWRNGGICPHQQITKVST